MEISDTTILAALSGDHNHHNFNYHDLVGNGEVLAAVNAGVQSMTAQFGNESREILTGQTSGFRDLVRATDGVHTHLADGIAALGVQTEKTAAAAQLAVAGVTKDVQLESKAIQIAALNTQMAIMSKMADCCCEIKQAINADGDTTRALISTVRIEDLQAQLTDAKDSARDQSLVNAILNQRGPQTSAKA